MRKFRSTIRTTIKKIENQTVCTIHYFWIPIVSLDSEVQEIIMSVAATTTDLAVSLAPVSKIAGSIVGSTLNEVSVATTPTDVGKAVEKGATNAAEMAGGAMGELVGAKLDKREKTVVGGFGLAALFLALAGGFTYVAIKAATKKDDKEKVVLVSDGEDQ